MRKIEPSQKSTTRPKRERGEFLLSSLMLNSARNGGICLSFLTLEAESVVLLSRINGFKKQNEILRQKHAAFQEKYKTMHNGGHNK